MDDAVKVAKQILDGEPFYADVKENPPSHAALERMALALEAASIDPDTAEYDLLIALAENYLRQLETLPVWLAEFAADVLAGKRKRPTKRGTDKYANWGWKYNLYRAVQEVARLFDLPAYTNNELSQKTTAAEIVSRAAGCSTAVVITAYKDFNRLTDKG